LLSFLQFAPKAREYIFNFMRYFTHIYSFVVFGFPMAQSARKAAKKRLRGRRFVMVLWKMRAFV